MPRPICFAPRAACVIAVLLGLCATAFAQDPVTQEAPAHISLVEGTAILERDGETDSSPSSMPLLAGDRVRTRAGRVEILFADGSTLHLDAHTVVDFQSDEVIRLLEGRVRLNIAGPHRAIAYRIDAPSGWVEVKEPGEYRVALVGGERGQEVELAVLRGAADLVNENGATPLRAGERSFAAAGAAPSQPYVFNSAAWDAFDRWSESRREQRLGISAQYLPEEARPYAASLDYHGSWRHEPSYGYVWYPRVSTGWRPYYYGRWSHLRPYGWTWIGHDPWAWPTHHYGRWGFSAGVWFWIPGRHWGPAWVSWAYAPGYVSWCPLGFNNRPVFSFVNVNIFGGRRFDRWHAWTVVPHRRFGSGFVNVNVINVNHVDVRTRRAFTVRNAAPEFRGRATPRSSVPIRVAGYAVPRNGSAVGSSSQAPGARSREAFRQRGTAGERLNGPGFPAAARDGRPAAIPRAGAGRTPSASSRDRTAPAAPHVERGRAVPRTSAPNATPAPGRGTPSRRVAPRGADAPAATAAAPDAGRSRAVPRAGQPPASQPPSRGTPSRRVAPRGGGGSSASAPALRSGPAPAPSRSRGVPRTGQPPAAPAPSRGTPSRRAAPGGGGGSSASAPARGSGSAAAPAPSPRRGGAVPRGRQSSAAVAPAGRSYGRSSAAAAPSYRGPVSPARSDRSGGASRALRRGPEQPSYQAPRPGSRSSSAAPPSRAYSGPRTGRSTGAARPAPSSPAPGPSRSASPSRGSSGGSSSAAPSSRSRGGQPSGGTARRRGGGN